MSLERSVHDLHVDIFVLKIGQEMMSLEPLEVTQLFDFSRFSRSSDRQACATTATSLTALLSGNSKRRGMHTAKDGKKTSCRLAKKRTL